MSPTPHTQTTPFPQLHPNARFIGDGEETMKELVVIGAGPHALTLLLRLLEDEPDLLTEDFRARISGDHALTVNALGSNAYIRDKVASMFCGCTRPNLQSAKQTTSVRSSGTRKKKRGLKGATMACGTKRAPEFPAVPLQMLLSGAVEVIDGHGEWLAEWHRNFDAYRIPHLRSPVDMHPGAHDMRELREYADIAHRLDNLVQMTTMPRDKVFKGPYVMPSTKLFADYCNKLIDKHHLRQVITRDHVVSVDRQRAGMYKLRLKSGRTVLTKRVVCALGPTMKKEQLPFEMGLDYYPADTKVHAHDIADWLRRFSLRFEGAQSSMRRPRVLVIGGGITSAHIVHRLRQLGCREISMLVRSQLRERQFDLDKSWFGPGRGKLLQRFASASPSTRLHILREARGGGSMPRECLAMIDRAIECGDLDLRIGVQVASASWVSCDNSPQLIRWCSLGRNQGEGCETQEDSAEDDLCGSSISSTSSLSNECSESIGHTGHWEVCITDGDIVKADVLLMATGPNVDLDEYPVLDQLRRQVPIDVCGGLPVLQPDLSWGEGESVYLMGALAAIELGPDALNLAGARHGACRLARTLRAELSGASA